MPNVLRGESGEMLGFYWSSKKEQPKKKKIGLSKVF